MSLWLVDMNQRVKKPGLWSASWCAPCASCGWRWSESAVVLMGLRIRYLAWVARLATFWLFGAGAGDAAFAAAGLVAVAGAAAATFDSETGEAAVLLGAAGTFAPGMCPPLDAIHCANLAGAVTSTAIGMKPWRAPHSSEHWPK